MPFVTQVEPFTQGDDKHGLVKFWHNKPVYDALIQTQVKLDVATLVKHWPLGEHGFGVQGLRIWSQLLPVYG